MKEHRRVLFSCFFRACFGADTREEDRRDDGKDHWREGKTSDYDAGERPEEAL